MTTLVLDNFIDKKYSKYFSRYFQDDLKIFDASNMQFPEELDKQDHIILSGSEDSILNERDYIDKEMEFVRTAIEHKIPTLGICFGHQLIARALLGLEGVRKAKRPELGWKKVTFTKDTSLVEGIEKEFNIFNSHFDEVCNLSDDFEVLAVSDMSEVQAFQINGAPVWGIQFHPEIDVESGKEFIADLKVLFPHLSQEMDEAILDVNDSGISEELFSNFYKL
jgi:GMP synthase (glutamine-hydrolysing)